MSAGAPSIGQRASVAGTRVAGVVSCVPSRVVGNDHFEQRFGAASAADVVKMIGVHTRRWVAEGQSTADLCQAATQRLLAGIGWAPDSVDAILFVSQTPDYRLPATACALAGRLGLRRGGIAFDVNLGCSGYPYGLWLASTIVASGAARRVLLAVGDTISRIVDPDDRATAMLFGDAGTVTAIEAADGATPAHFLLGTDGAGETHLIVPAGGFRARGAAQDARLADRDPACLFMDGSEIFNFTLSSVPGLVGACLEQSGRSAAEHDAFLFHQANAFMLKHIVKKAKLPTERVPVNIDRFGNTSSASIPLLLTNDLAPALRERSQRLAMFGFGVGYSWACASIEIGPLACVETIEA